MTIFSSSSLPRLDVPRHGGVRGSLFALALVLACQAGWLLVCEIYRPTLPGFPQTAQAAAAFSGMRENALRAAKIGAVRGDLWVDCALTYLSLFWPDDRSTSAQQQSEMPEGPNGVIDRAVAFAPYDGRAWLALAALDSRFDWLNRKASAALRMSYYTATNAPDLIPLRLLLAVRSDALADIDFQELVEHDMRVIVTRKRELTPVIMEAYRDALPIGRQFIERTLADLDPALLTNVRSTGIAD